MGSPSGVLCRGRKRHHSLFRKSSLAAGWRREFGGSGQPVRRLWQEPMGDIMMESSGVGEIPVMFGR